MPWILIELEINFIPLPVLVFKLLRAIYLSNVSNHKQNFSYLTVLIVYSTVIASILIHGLYMWWQK